MTDPYRTPSPVDPDADVRKIDDKTRADLWFRAVCSVASRMATHAAFEEADCIVDAYTERFGESRNERNERFERHVQERNELIRQVFPGYGGKP